MLGQDDGDFFPLIATKSHREDSTSTFFNFFVFLPAAAWVMNYMTVGGKQAGIATSKVGIVFSYLLTLATKPAVGYIYFAIACRASGRISSLVSSVAHCDGALIRGKNSRIPLRGRESRLPKCGARQLGPDVKWAKPSTGHRDGLGNGTNWAPKPTGHRDQMGTEANWAPRPTGHRSQLGTETNWAPGPTGHLEFERCLPA